nr:hypothetical protein [Tanacetum cinerariifolium]
MLSRISFHVLYGRTLTKSGDFISELVTMEGGKYFPRNILAIWSKVLIEFLGRRSNQAVACVRNKMLQGIPTTSYDDPTASTLCHCLPEFVDDTVTDYSSPTPSIDASKCNKRKTWPKDNYTHKSMTPRAILRKPGTTPIVGNLQNNIDDKGYWDSGCSWHMTGNISYLSEYEPYDRGYVSFGHGDSDYGGATQDKKSTSGGCQFLGRRLVSWIETTNQETKILATVDGKPQTISESSLRRHLKLNDGEGISSLPDTELFENLSLMGYNILPNQSNIATDVVCLATNKVYNFSKMIFDGMVRNINSEGFTNPTEPHHTPSLQEHHSPQHDSPPPSNQTIISEPIPQAPTETLTPRRYTRRAIQIAQSKALSPAADEPVSLSRDDRQGEAFPTVFSLDAGGGAAASVSPADVHPAAGVPTVSGSFPTSKPLSKKEQREFYMSVLRTHAGWKTKLFRGLTLEQIKEKFIPVWKQFNDFVPMSSKEESERVKGQGLKIDQGSSKRMKISEGASKEELKGMMQLQFDREDLHQLWALVKETFSTKQATRDKEKELWKLYDTCGVHHVSTKDQEIFMLVEKDYPLRKGLATVMIIQDEELIEASSPGEHLILET